MNGLTENYCCILFFLNSVFPLIVYLNNVPDKQNTFQPHCKKIRRFYGKIPGIWLPVLLPLFLRAF